MHKNRIVATALAAGTAILLATAAASASAPQGEQAPLDDPTIVAIFDAANTADIETGKLAEKLGSNKEVRDFGAMLARDHEQVRKLGRDLSAKLGVTPTPPKNDPSLKAHADAMTRLRGLKGSAFDHAFLQHEVAYHQGVIDAINKTLLPAIKNTELKALVLKVAPAFEAHRVAARTLDEKLSKVSNR